MDNSDRLKFDESMNGVYIGGPPEASMFSCGRREGLRDAYLALLRKVEDRDRWCNYEPAVRLLEEKFPELKRD